VEVDGVFACDDVGDGAAAGLSGRLLAGGLGGWGHFCREDMLANAHCSHKQRGTAERGNCAKQLG
jgi:hypothetical protein